MRGASLGGPFESSNCPECGEERYVDEPCPKCTAGDYDAMMDRLEASMNRETFLLQIVERLLKKLGEDDDPPPC